MNNEYITINKTAIQKRIKKLEQQEQNEFFDEQKLNSLLGQIHAYKQILSQSTPLIPEIEKVFDEGAGVGIISYQPEKYTLDKELYNERKQDYISNLKFYYE